MKDIISLQSGIREISLISMENADYVLALVNEYDRIVSLIVEDKNTPDFVFEFLLSENENLIKSNSEFYFMVEFSKFLKMISNQLKNEIKKCLKKNQYKKIYKILPLAIKINIKNVELVVLIKDLFLKNKLYKELADIYKLIFVYSLNPNFFEKIGDLYCKLKDYNSALNQYLTYAENVPPNKRIYKKLAKVFNELNDKESSEMCLKQALLLENNDGQ